jgi:hypothetical protein
MLSFDALDGSMIAYDLAHAGRAGPRCLVVDTKEITG